MQIRQALEKGTIELKISNIESPKMKARLLMQFVLNKSRQYIIVNDTQNLTTNQEEMYKKAIEKLKKGIPIEHITHQKEFMKLTFFVDNNVLIPRQDTETVVEEAIKIGRTIKNVQILDLCTGSGAIAVSLAKYIKNSKITAIDISHKAIQIAKKNAINNKVESQITFLESDLFENLPEQKYDIIISNPPYIKKDVLKSLSKQVKKEPIIALDGGYDGLDFYRKIISKAYDYLKFSGYLILEIGYDQKEDVIDLIKKQDKYNKIYCKKDLCGNDRVIVTY